MPKKMSRRELLDSAMTTGAIGLAGLAISADGAGAEAVPAFDLEEATLADLRQGMDSGKYTARALTEKYLERIGALDQRGPVLNHIIELNPDALAVADALDAERKANGPRGPLHGAPIFLKDNIDTAGRMTTTAGSLALAGWIPPRDASLVEKLRRAGVVILGKANMSEWANFRSSRSSSGWSARGGQGKNPYALDRTPSGSSSGSAGSVAANYCVAAVGTETDGSIMSPSNCCSVVGIKPTVGLVSRTGIIPIAHSQDTAGPIARTVSDAAMLLGAMTGVDPDDEATKATAGKSESDYTKYLRKDGLKGARIGVLRSKGRRSNPGVEALFQTALGAMKSQGAELIDPVEVSTLGQFGDAEFEVLLYEFKADLNAYLAKLPASVSVHSLKELIEFNDKNRAEEMPFFGQETLLQAQEKGPLDSAAYLEALAKCRKLSREQGMDATMEKHILDAIVAITGGPATLIDLVNGDYGSGSSSSLAAVSGYPSITVPAGYVFGLPVGLSFMGKAFSEGVMIRLAYAFEQTTKLRRPPRFLQSAEIPATKRGGH